MPTPTVGAEIDVHVPSGSEQRWPTVAAMADGRFVIAWYDANGAATEFYRMRTFDAAGDLIGPVRTVGQAFFLPWQEDRIELAGLPSNQLAVAYHDFGSGTVFYDRYLPGSNGYQQTSSTFVRRNSVLDNGVFLVGPGDNPFIATHPSNGSVAVGFSLPLAPNLNQFGYTLYNPEFKTGAGLHSTVADYFAPEAAMGEDGELVFVYKTGSNVMIEVENTGPMVVGAGSYAHIARLADGGFAVTWDGGGQVFTRIYDKGDSLAARTSATTVDATNASEAHLCALSDGRYLVVWRDLDPAGTFHTAWIRGRLYNADGSADSDVFNIDSINGNATQTAVHGGPRAAELADGRIVVTYHSGFAYSSGVVDPDIRARILDPRTGPVELGGSTFNDDNVGTAFGDRMSGGLGNDRLAGAGGNDALFGGIGSDTFVGGLGTDAMTGGTGADTFVFTASADTAVGAPRDVIQDWGSADKIDVAPIDANATLPGNQDFTFRGLGSTDRIVAQGELKFYHFGGNTYVVGNTAAGTEADFQIEILGTHTLTTDNFLGLRNAVLTGTGGNDTLKGTNGNDTLTGLGGKDSLFGRLGADTFAFTSTIDTQAGANRDVIRDWQNVDKIDVDLIDANTSVGGDQDFTFLGLGSTDHNVGQGQIKFYQYAGNTYVVGNATADTQADFQIEIIGAHTLTSSHFVGLI